MSTETLPPTLWGFDEPRARRSDANTSQAAADRTQARLSEVKKAILLIAATNPPMLDTELNDLYASNWEQRGWPKQRWDSPRKRRSDLTTAGLLKLTGVERSNRFGCPEQEWTLA